jgi:hypothetical protein
MNAEAAPNAVNAETAGVLLGQTYVTVCPHCNSTQLHASRSRWNDIAARALFAHPFRCLTCYSRFYVWPWAALLERASTTVRTLIFGRSK